MDLTAAIATQIEPSAGEGAAGCHDHVGGEMVRLFLERSQWVSAGFVHLAVFGAGT